MSILKLKIVLKLLIFINNYLYLCNFCDIPASFQCVLISRFLQKNHYFLYKIYILMLFFRYYASIMQRQILTIARKYSIIIIEGEYYGNFFKN